jgi:hypothetical protein
MLPPTEARWTRIILGYVVFGGLLALASTPVYFSAEPAHRPMVVRTGAALLAGVALIHMRRIARASVDAQPDSAFEEAIRSPAVEPRFAPLLLKLRDEVRISRKDQRYFEHVLWARMLRILLDRQGRASAPPEIPQGRRSLRRGPSLEILRDLIAKIEERP